MSHEPPLLEVCDDCGGQGFIEYADHPNQPIADYSKPCRRCAGTGSMLVNDAEPIEMEDLA